MNKQKDYPLNEVQKFSSIKEMLEIDGLYKEESIKSQINKINDLYNLQFEITEVNLGTNYNMDAYTKGK